jgi:hypothetical protein
MAITTNNSTSVKPCRLELITRSLTYGEKQKNK